MRVIHRRYQHLGGVTHTKMLTDPNLTLIADSDSDKQYFETKEKL
jgi:hypothetical protein